MNKGMDQNGVIDSGETVWDGRFQRLSGSEVKWSKVQKIRRQPCEGQKFCCFEKAEGNGRYFR